MKRAFKLEGLSCANCAAKIEKDIKALDGVSSAFVNFATARLTIEAEDAKFDEIAKKACEIVKRYEPDVALKRA